MKSSSYLIALKVAQIIEEHQEKDIRLAVQFLQNAGHNSSLLDYLLGSEKDVRNSQPVADRNRDVVEITSSRSISKLMETEPEKFQLLADFERMLKKGQVLSTHENLKRFGEQLSKDFHPRKSRKETIGPLLEIWLIDPCRSSRGWWSMRRLLVSLVRPMNISGLRNLSLAAKNSTTIDFSYALFPTRGTPLASIEKS